MITGKPHKQNAQKPSGLVGMAEQLATSLLNSNKPPKQSGGGSGGQQSTSAASGLLGLATGYLSGHKKPNKVGSAPKNTPPLTIMLTTISATWSIE